MDRLIALFVFCSLIAIWTSFLYGAALMIRAMNGLDYQNAPHNLTRSYHMIFGATLFIIACFCFYIIGRNL